MMPNFFRDQLPEPIRKISDNRRVNSPRVDGYTYVTEYCYPIRGGDGKPFETSLAVIMGHSESVIPAVGSAVCLSGVWVTVTATDIDTEVCEEDGRLIKTCTATVKEAGNGSR